MRVLDFGTLDGNAAQFFALVYDGLTNTQRSFRAPTETRVIGSVQSKLEAIARAVTRGEGSPLAFASFDVNDTGERMVRLEEAEYKLLIESLEQAPFNARGARDATRLLDWIHAAPSQKVAE